jgi:hypothetical protein
MGGGECLELRHILEMRVTHAINVEVLINTDWEVEIHPIKCQVHKVDLRLSNLQRQWLNGLGVVGLGSFNLFHIWA